jgi:glutamate 5-kinase
MSLLIRGSFHQREIVAGDVLVPGGIEDKLEAAGIETMNGLKVFRLGGNFEMPLRSVAKKKSEPTLHVLQQSIHRACKDRLTEKLHKNTC